MTAENPTARASMWRSPGGALWTVTHRWTGGHGGPSYVRLRSMHGATRKMLASDLARDWVSADDAGGEA